MKDISNKSDVEKFSLINTIEGYSYLILIFIAMPLKYIFNMPYAVKIVGMAHGVLFVIFCYYLLKAHKEAGWSFLKSTIFFIASLIPFGTMATKSKITQDINIIS